MAIVGVVALAAISTTLAGQIIMNSSQAVEFGQGVSVTAACDVTGGITLAPSASFANAAGATGVFNLGTVSFSGIDSTCAGKVFTLKAYGDTSSTPVTLTTTGASTTWSFATFAFSTVTTANHSSNTNGVQSAGTGTNGTYDLGWTDTRTASAQAISKFTLESSAN